MVNFGLADWRTDRKVKRELQDKKKKAGRRL